MLKELIDQFYLENQKNKDQTKFYITDAGKCPRAVFLNLKMLRANQWMQGFCAYLSAEKTFTGVFLTFCTG